MKNSKVSETTPASCINCPYEHDKKPCTSNYSDSLSSICPSVRSKELVEKCLNEYSNPSVCEFARQASIQEGEGYENRELGYERLSPIKPRILETMEFAEKMGYRRLGLAYCTGLRRETAVLEHLLVEEGFEVVSVVCKAGGIPKEKIGVPDSKKILPGSFETMCNPVMQALILNRDRTELNIILGLCVGHDALLFKYSDAPCTVLAVKDRLLGHNPLAAIYTIDSYYRSIRHLKNKEKG